jgi:hypothetical protein
MHDAASALVPPLPPPSVPITPVLRPCMVHQSGRPTNMDAEGKSTNTACL